MFYLQHPLIIHKIYETRVSYNYCRHRHTSLRALLDNRHHTTIY